MQIRTSDGIALDARSIGTGPPLVFAHEFSSDARSWDTQLGFFSRYYRCTVYCARGYPPSDVPPGIDAYDQIRAAEDLADVVRAVGDGPAHVVGLSMGGFAALHLGLRHPELVRSLVVAGVGYGARPDQQAEHRVSALREADRAEAIGMAAFARDLADSAYAQCLRAKDETAWARFARRLRQHSVTGMAMTLRGVLARRPSLWELGDELRRLARPVLLAVGDEDIPCLEPKLFLKATLPDAALCVMPRAGHLLNLEEPALFNTIVFGFLAAVEHGRWSEWRGSTPDLGALQGGKLMSSTADKASGKAGRLAGKVALVTGASRGLGRGIAEGFAAEGARIVVNYLQDEKAATAVVNSIKKMGSDAMLARANIGEVGDVTAMVEAAVREFGTIDILVNNAGMLNSFKLAEMSVETWDEMIKVHLRGMFLCTRFAIPHMLKQKSGKIINMSGTFGVTGGAEFTHMSAAKAGMIGFTRALAREVGHDGINVNCIAPAIIRTDLYNFMPNDVRDAIVGAYPLGRVGEVKDVVATALFLATSDGDYFTGQTLCPTGGDVMV